MSTENSTAKRLVAVRVLILTAFAALLLYGSTDLPYRGDTDNMMHNEESITGTPVPGNYYIREAYNDAHTPNMVTVILGDYRGIDTLGEQVVVFTAGMICLLILRRIGREDDNVVNNGIDDTYSADDTSDSSNQGENSATSV